MLKILIDFCLWKSDKQFCYFTICITIFIFIAFMVEDLIRERIKKEEC